MTQESQFTLRLQAIYYGAKDTNLYEFVLPDGGALPAVEPGSHIDLHLPNGMVRQYSLVESDDNPQRYLIGIKRDPNSKGGSLYIHDSLKVGTLIVVSMPRNNFHLNEEAKLTVLFAGGIGITPIYNMLQRLIALGRQYQFYYACRSRDEAVFFKELSSLDNVHFHFDDESEESFLNIPEIVAAYPTETHFYCCGPGPMLNSFEEALTNRDSEFVHVEYFTQKEEAAVEGGFTVVLSKSDREVVVAPGQTILNVLLDAGLDMPFSCEQGICGSCEVNVIEGTPDHRDAILTDSERAAGKTMMVCCSGSKSKKLVLDV
jgi:tetrachlorobenzoquinone reductase